MYKYTTMKMLYTEIINLQRIILNIMSESESELDDNMHRSKRMRERQRLMARYGKSRVTFPEQECQLTRRLKDSCLSLQ